MDSLTMQFLVAMPQLHQTYFERAVILMIEHNADGAMGLVINKRPNLSTKELFSQLSLPTPSSSELVLSDGGPVAPQQGFVIHQDMKAAWKSTVKLTDDLSVSTSLDVIEALANDHGPEKALMAVGYAGWEENQLEEEIQDNAWLTLPFDSNIVMNTPQDAMLDTLTLAHGIPYNHMVSSAGHA